MHYQFCIMCCKFLIRLLCIQAGKMDFFFFFKYLLVHVLTSDFIIIGKNIKTYTCSEIKLCSLASGNHPKTPAAYAVVPQTSPKSSLFALFQLASHLASCHQNIGSGLFVPFNKVQLGSVIQISLTIGKKDQLKMSWQTSSIQQTSSQYFQRKGSGSETLFNNHFYYFSNDFVP